MVIYNVTTKIHHHIHADWLSWLKKEHIPAMLETKCFITATVVRLLETDDTDGPTYAVQYHTESIAIYNNYIEKHSAVIRQQSFSKWGNQFISFRSVMQVVN